jgi:tRNA(Ile)-lysidine synthase
MNVSKQIQQSIIDLWPFELWRDATVVIGVSGGPDSMALLHSLHGMQGMGTRFVVAHFNHAMRGEESDADERFVREESQRLGIECVVRRASQEQMSGRSENRLRIIRHNYLVEVAAKHSANWIALAHHADDCVETFLNNLLRGSGPSGLAGIPIVRQLNAMTRLVRPLLRVTRVQIMQYMSEQNLSYRLDRSNASCEYTRNRIRHELLPLLRSFAGSDALDRRLFQASELIAEEHAVVSSLAKDWLLQCGYRNGETTAETDALFSIPLKSCMEVEWPIVRHALTIVWHEKKWPMREMSLRHWRRLRLLIESAPQSTHPKRMDLPGGIVVKYRRGLLTIGQPRSSEKN